MSSSKIFEKYILNNGIEIRNRLVVAPMTLFVANEDGTFSDEDFKFMSKRGENIGMFIVEATLICWWRKSFHKTARSYQWNAFAIFKKSSWNST